jgi:hypothetical protein
MGRPSELKDKFFRAQLLAGVHPGDTAVPKFEQDLEEPAAVERGVLVKEIDITSETRVTVINYGLSANDETTDPHFRQETEEREDVSGKARFYDGR